MLDPVLNKPRALLGALRRSERSVFWTSFVLSLAISACWVFATPIFGAPDEPAHSMRAASVARLEILGHKGEESREELVVDAPRNYTANGGAVACFAFSQSIPASCARISDDPELVPTYTPSGRHTPSYYLVAGLPTLLLRDSSSIYLMRLVSALITALFVAASVASLRRLRGARVASLGFVLALTPLVWFVSGSVNPSAAEIAGGFALWACGGVLALRASEEVDPVLVRRVAIAAIVLCLSRQLGPLWLVGIALVLGLVAGWSGVRRIFATTTARIWSVGVAAAALSTVLWDLIVKPVNPRASEQIDINVFGAGRASLAQSFTRFKQFVGWFGWLDTPPTPLMVWLFSIALVALVVVAFLYGNRRLWWLALLVAAATVAIPVAFEAYAAHDLNYFWQSRYTLPIATGVPILLGLSLAARTRVEATQRRVGATVVSVAVMSVAVQVLGFGQALRRNTVGYEGPLDFFLHPIWQPPVRPWLLLGAAIVAVVAFTYWLVGAGPTRSTPTRDAPDASDPALTAT